MREFELLKQIYRANDQLGQQITIPPGDDMGGIMIEGVEVLAAVDQLVAGRHFDLARTPIELIGRKAVTRNLSDIAAMAARPVASLAAGVLPPNFGASRADELFEAMRQTAAAYGCPLIGGDLAFHSDAEHPLTLTVTVLAQAIDAAHPPVRRSGAQPGDRLYVTGVLGGTFDENGLGHHLTFEPRVELAIELARQLGSRLHAMIDISDGLGRDAGHLAEQSNVRIVLDADRILCREAINWRRAMSDGEDYELCFAAEGAVPASVAGIPITCVGEVHTSSDRIEGAHDDWRVIIRLPDHRIESAADLGWEHVS